MHAICVHDGGAQSGHYYTFIKDHYQNVWRKFNDIKVDIVSEQDVFEQANGGQGHKTAFWVVYLSRTEVQTASQYNLYHMHQAQYRAMISPSLHSEINVINSKLQQELTDSKDAKLLIQVNEKYLSMIE